VKKIILIVVVLAIIGGGVFYWVKKHPDADDKAKPAEKAADDDDAGTKVSRDDKGNAVISMSDDAQGDNGINVAKAEAAQYDRELKGYGHVLDPAPLAALLNELATSLAAYIASSNELARLKTLSAQGNASARALQTGQAAALHDDLAVQSAKDRIALQWGKAVAEQSDPAAFMKSLTSLEQALVRIDLPAAENGPAAPGNARIVSLAGKSVEGAFFGLATSVDPQTQGRGYIFLVAKNGSGLAPGEAVTGFIKMGGEPLAGTIVPGTAVVRTEGSGWAYVLQGNAEDFVRVPVALDRPVDNGWFVTNGVTASNYVVTAGAQTLLSEELKGAAKPPD
jgi:hypothetical protein